MRLAKYILGMLAVGSLFFGGDLLADQPPSFQLPAFARRDYVIVHQNSGMLLDTTYWEPKPGQVVKVYPRNPDGNPTPSQLWVIRQHKVTGWPGEPAKQAYSIVHKASGLLLDTTSWNPKDGQVVKVFPSGPGGMPSRSQLWYLSQPYTTGRPYYTIRRMIQEDFGKFKVARHGFLDTERWYPAPGQVVKVFRGATSMHEGKEVGWGISTSSQRWDLVPVK
jgi:hypothetical protein